MDFKDFTTGKDDEGRRFDRIVRIFLEEKSLPEIYKLIRKGLIKLNHKKTKPEVHITQGDIISIASFLLEEEKTLKTSEAQSVSFTTSTAVQAPEKSALNIVFKNEHLLILDKPYNRTVHGEKDGLYHDVISYYENHVKNSQKNGASNSLSFRPGPLHRLDRLTTGLIVFSLSIKGARWFSEGIKNHTIHKKYYAIALGHIQNAEQWCDRLSDSQENGIDNKSTTSKVSASFHTVKQDQNGLEAQTYVKPLAYGNYKGKPVTFAEYSIKTGRKHQIRAQSSIHNHPLLGDTAYGAYPIKATREFYLQAFELEFPENNPLSLPPVIKIGLSSDFIEQLHYCEIENPGL